MEVHQWADKAPAREHAHAAWTTVAVRGNDTGPRMDLVEEAERLGYDSVWSSEAYGTDAVTPIAWVLARTTRIKGGTGIMQMPARTPACAAMTAMALQAMSNDRFLLGIGPSGPQVIEGWHGEPYGKPLARTKEYIEIIRKIFAREEPLQHRGRALPDPLRRSRRQRARQAAQEHSQADRRHQDLHGRVRAGRAQDGWRSRRRHAADLHEPGEARCRRQPRAGWHGGGR